MTARQRVARGVMKVARRVVRLVPRAVVDLAEDRLFYAVFQLTRVTNDNYGSRVDPDSGGQGGAEAARPLRRG